MIIALLASWDFVFSRIEQLDVFKKSKVSASYFLCNISVSQERSNETKINKKAVEILDKVKRKLTGFDDITEKYLDVENQVQSLIRQATATENLCQLYMGWCPFW